MFESFLIGAVCGVLGLMFVKHWMQRQEQHKARELRMFDEGYNSDGTPRAEFPSLWWPMQDRANGALMALTDRAQFEETLKLHGQKGVEQLRAALKDQLA